MPSTIPLSVAIYDNPGIKHWSLFIEGDSLNEKTLIHLLGARSNYFFNIRTSSDAKNSKSLVEMIFLCHINASEIESIKNTAEKMTIRNDSADYSCQDFILELLNTLEEEAIIDPTNADYADSKQILRQKREAWQ
ncbi:hypothetical protein AJ78_06497 [Emergomyces pasteurianus Ep9510]|uniref:Uncharacterized protein n=1 Tax=Emergomyces pasteurianus Ep9510 TaxID=1447872 RepID=A0A1J9PA95_9EURO|nr:hypothetical protein AJ78_06497 [Emergomyces pasteurianus Ep9510]